MAADTIDCDIHPGVPDIKTLLPYMNEFWQESFVARGIDGFDMMSYPLNAPITCRPDWRVKGQRPGASLAAMRNQALETFGIATAICNPLTGGQVAVSESMGAAICSAVNDWIREHWLDKEPRLRASIVVPTQAPLLAAQEIDRCAGDSRFVQVLIPVACELMLGRSYYWPIWEAAATTRPANRHSCGQHVPARPDRDRMAVALPARLRRAVPDVRGSTPQPCLQRRVQQVPQPEIRPAGIRCDLASWLYLAGDKTWRGVRAEVPWVNRSPAEIIRENIRLTINPSMRRTERPSNASLSRSTPTTCCCSPPTTRTGNSRAMPSSRLACPPICNTKCAWTTRWKPIPA